MVIMMMIFDDLTNSSFRFVENTVHQPYVCPSLKQPSFPISNLNNFDRFS